LTFETLLVWNTFWVIQEFKEAKFSSYCPVFSYLHDKLVGTNLTETRAKEESATDAT